ncbi:GNAT family N-acetyltransferase [Fibrella forsythiae]|uniref:GNAT family N-acetyltransferase n=1 Tax=Fibrella forsythiae TaxID=2817061 RepID=A0ABS3JLK9_9BACT|nr:GNAT family N-acetyltransferase [Fibrella forsythiae]MBO0949787.1 GNAT family N-acetyltransferase [Fibrella forsythiae]
MITYRFAQLPDAQAIAALHTQSWRQTYRGILRDDYLDGNISEDRFAVWHKRLATPATNQRILVAEEDGQLRGFICLYLDEDPELGTLIDNLHVSRAAKGRGIGLGLMREAARRVIPEANHPGFHLVVYEANGPAIQFYNRVGGMNLRPEQYETPGDGSTAIILRYVWKTADDLR